MDLNLKNQKMKLTIDSNGAYIKTLTYDGKNIFFPKFEAEINGKKKLRGGCHPCLPNFGDSDINDLKAHGYGRVSEWEVAEEYADRLLLKLEGREGYEGMTSFIFHKLADDNIKISLKLTNNSNKDLPIAPGFHPYFHVDENFKIEGLDLTDIKLPDTYFHKASYIKFRGKYFEIEIYSQNFKEFAIWTDYVDDYICVEPCFNGKSFTKAINNPYILKAGEEFKAEFIIRVNNNLNYIR